MCIYTCVYMTAPDDLLVLQNIVEMGRNNLWKKSSTTEHQWSAKSNIIRTFGLFTFQNPVSRIIGHPAKPMTRMISNHSSNSSWQQNVYEPHTHFWNAVALSLCFLFPIASHFKVFPSADVGTQDKEQIIGVWHIYPYLYIYIARDR